jgi:hypothetical protein
VQLWSSHVHLWVQWRELGLWKKVLLLWKEELLLLRWPILLGGHPWHWLSCLLCWKIGLWLSRLHSWMHPSHRPWLHLSLLEWCALLGICKWTLYWRLGCCGLWALYGDGHIPGWRRCGWRMASRSVCFVFWWLFRRLCWLSSPCPASPLVLIFILLLLGYPRDLLLYFFLCPPVVDHFLSSDS